MARAIGRFLLGWSVALTGCLAAVAADAGDEVERGAALADQWCVSCHATGTTGTVSDRAPSFPLIANDPRIDAAYLRAFLADPHGPMEGFSLPGKEIDDLAAYIMSLREL